MTDLITLLFEGEPRQRAQAAIQLALSGAHPQQAARALIHALVTDPDTAVRTNAAEALGYLRSNDAVTVLTRASRDADDSVREAARIALDRVRGGGEERRISSRHSTQIPAQFYTPDSAAIRRGVVLNLSRHGLFLGQTVGLEPGMAIRMVLHDQERRVPPLGCTARVVREADRRETDGYGCALLPLQGEKARWLDRLIELSA